MAAAGLFGPGRHPGSPGSVFVSWGCIPGSLLAEWLFWKDWSLWLRDQGHSVIKLSTLLVAPLVLTITGLYFDSLASFSQVSPGVLVLRIGFRKPQVNRVMFEIKVI